VWVKLAPGGVRGESSRHNGLQRMQKKKLYDQQKQKDHARTYRNEEVLQLL
jgi:hypothetical protein